MGTKSESLSERVLEHRLRLRVRHLRRRGRRDVEHVHFRPSGSADDLIVLHAKGRFDQPLNRRGSRDQPAWLQSDDAADRTRAAVRAHRRGLERLRRRVPRLELSGDAQRDDQHAYG
jgi:hypothetical protein